MTAGGEVLLVQGAQVQVQPRRVHDEQTECYATCHARIDHCEALCFRPLAH